MKKISILLIFFLAIVLSGCSISQAKCQLSGGKWYKNFGETSNFCLIKYSDAGKSCVSSRECQGGCVVSKLNQLGKTGICKERNRREGCEGRIEDKEIYCFTGDDLAFRCNGSEKDNKDVCKEVYDESKSPAVYENLSVFDKQDQDNNYLIVKKNNIETIVDQAPAKYSDKNPDVASFSYFSFSPKGNYLLYRVDSYESRLIRVYDLNAKKLAQEYDSAGQSGFTQDEKFFFVCASSDFSGQYYAKVYSLPGFQLKKDLIDSFTDKKATNIDCQYNKDSNSLTVTNQIDELDSQTVTYNFNDGSVRVIDLIMMY